MGPLHELRGTKKTLALPRSEEDPAPRQRAQRGKGKRSKLSSPIELFPKKPKKKGKTISRAKFKRQLTVPPAEEVAQKRKLVL